jgi:beta-phosphoglucomutase-like phosphatase (HAD superfamily)
MINNNTVINDFDLFIFDLDDTLVKSEKFQYEAWLITLQHFFGDKFYICENTFQSIFHSMIPNNIEKYIISLLNIDDCQDVVEYKNKTYFDIITKKKDEIKMIDGCEVFLNKIIDNNKQFVIVSNSLKIHIDFFSELFPILKHSSKNYYREMFKNKKPNPECYLKVVDDYPNKKMVCFEDSITGIHAITRIPEIVSYYINTVNYFHHRYILENYNVLHINNYNDLLF